MATRRMQEFLDGNHAQYCLLRHSPAYSACEVAEAAHIPGRAMAKVVIVIVNGRLAMAVVPATREVDMGLLQQVTGTRNVRLAEENEFVGRFEGCQLGSEPPFGNLFGIETYIEPELGLHDRIAFNAGTHQDTIIMSSEDYIRLANPTFAHIDTGPIIERFATTSI